MRAYGVKRWDRGTYSSQQVELFNTAQNAKIRYLVNITILDRFVKENKISKVDFIKVDIEGYEENVLLVPKKL